MNTYIPKKIIRVRPRDKPNNSIHLMSTAAVLPLSTAEVERVFSQVKLVKCDHINLNYGNRRCKWFFFFFKFTIKTMMPVI
jgi:hypothetical protein